MQLTLGKLVKQHLDVRWDELWAAKERADAIDTSKMVLGDAMRAELVAATRAHSYQDLITGAQVVKKLKRAALLQVGCLLYYCNRYGVLTALVPSGLRINCLGTVWGPGIPPSDRHELLAQMGAKIAGHERSDPLYDYSGCTEFPQPWMAAESGRSPQRWLRSRPG